MGNNAFFGIHEALALQLRDKYGLKVLIETGTYCGASSLWAKDNGFIVYTVEADKDRWENLTTTFRRYEDTIHFYRGDTRDMLPVILEAVKEPALIFLDAHYSQSVGGGIPLMKEIEAIKKRRLHHIVMIDDARLFGEGVDWPSKEKVMQALQKTGRIVYEFEDVIVGEYE